MKNTPKNTIMLTHGQASAIYRSADAFQGPGPDTFIPFDHEILPDGNRIEHDPARTDMIPVRIGMPTDPGAKISMKIIRQPPLAFSESRSGKYSVGTIIEETSQPLS